VLQASWFARMVAHFCERLGDTYLQLHMLADALAQRVLKGVRQEVRPAQQAGGGGCRPCAHGGSISF
jgi:hypothetical protein